MSIPALTSHSIRQVSAAGKFSGARWLVFLHSVSQLLRLDVPFDCELLAAQWNGRVARLTEVYRISPGMSPHVRNFGDWSPGSRGDWPSIGLYRRRTSLNGHVIRTVILEDVCLFKQTQMPTLYFFSDTLVMATSNKCYVCRS